MRLEGGWRLELFIEPSSVNMGELGPVKEAPGFAWALFAEGPLWLAGQEGEILLARFWEISPEPVRR